MYKINSTNSQLYVSGGRLTVYFGRQEPDIERTQTGQHLKAVAQPIVDRLNRGELTEHEALQLLLHVL